MLSANTQIHSTNTQIDIQKNATTWAARANLRPSLQAILGDCSCLNSQIYQFKYKNTNTIFGTVSYAIYADHQSKFSALLRVLLKLDWLEIDGLLRVQDKSVCTVLLGEGMQCSKLRQHQTVETHPHGKSKAKFAFNWQPFILHTVTW